jgi:FkbM family methyltransferase
MIARKVISSLFHKLPLPLKEHISVMRRVNKALLTELSTIPVVESGFDEIKGYKTPFVILNNGTILYGRWPIALERKIYHRYKKFINPSITEDTIKVAMDVIDRYLYPHAMPQLTAPYSLRMRQVFSHSHQTDTINDIPQFSSVQKEQLKKKYSINPEESFLDIGSYMGYGAIRMCNELGSKAKILCVETDPDTLPLLEQNIYSNSLSNVIIIPKAIWSKENITLKLHKTNRQANSLIKGIVETSDTAMVQTTTVDAIVKKYGCMNIINMTVNGAEPEALEGAKETLQQCKNIRFSITGWYKRDGKRICDIISPMLQQYGFKVIIGREGKVLAYK